MVSSRASHLLAKTSPLVEAHFRCATDPWHPTKNPGGYVHLGTAENHLLWDILEPALASMPRRPDDTHYVELHGTPDLRAALAAYHGHMDPERMAVASGTSAALDILATALFEEGDAILVPAPYYSGFAVCLTARAGLRLVAVPMEAPDFSLTRDQLDEALRTAAAGANVRGLLLCMPHNPLGTIIPDEVVDGYVAWARKHGLHVIADEIYLHSVHGAGHQSSILARHNGPDIHVVYGMAKDVGLSGFKVGAVQSGDVEVVAATQNLAYTAPVSSQTQATVHHILGTMGPELRSENPVRLARAYAHLVQHLDAAGIPHHPAQAGLFAWIDLRNALAEPTFEAEQALYDQLLEARVNISPSSAFHGPEPGWFRVCFADDPDKVAEGIHRVASVSSVAKA